MVHAGKCFCGEVEFEVAGEPVAMGYCHCESCRQWSAAPVNAFSLWKAGAVVVRRGASSIDSFSKSANSVRKWCTRCGGHLFTDHPLWGLVDVYAALLPSFAFTPGLHVHYQETVLRMPDGRPKMKDLPAEMGGSAIALAD